MKITNEQIEAADTPFKASALFNEIHKDGAAKFGALWLVENEQAIEVFAAFGFDVHDPVLFDEEGGIDRVAAYKLQSLCSAVAFMLCEKATK